MPATPEATFGRKPLKELCCVNLACPDKGRRGIGNLSVRNGKGGGKWRILRCATCKTEFSERKGTALWGTRMSPEKAIAIAEHLKEGCGIRKTARLVGASKDGVTSIALRVGLHAHAFHDERARDLQVHEAQFDEKWAFVEKKQKHCDSTNPEDERKGDQWDHTAIDVDSRFVVSLSIGKRNRETLKEVVSDFADRTNNIPPALITTDNCNTYADVLLEQYGETVVPERSGKPGRPRKPFKQWPQNAAYATVNKTCSKGNIKAVDRKLVHGTAEDLDSALEVSPSSTKINTAFVERQNGTDRNYNARKARKTYEFSKDLLLHIATSWWVMLCYNFHYIHRGLRQKRADGSFLHRTPAMALGLEETLLSVATLIQTQVVGYTSPAKIMLNQFTGTLSAGPAP